MAEEPEKKNAEPETEGAVADEDVETVAGGIMPVWRASSGDWVMAPAKLADRNNR